MKLELCFGVAWLVVVFGLDSDSVYGDLPCHFSDAINITYGTVIEDKSITFNGIIFPSDQYAPKVSESESIGKRITVPTFGCYCNREKCIPFCGNEDQPHGEFELEILDENNQKKAVDLRKLFKIVTKSLICTRTELIVQITYEGNVLTQFDELKTQREYCLRKIDDNLPLNAEVCIDDTPVDESKHVNIGIGMLVSVPFLIATFFVYLSVPELRNLHGKCFLCYLFCLIMAFIPLAIVKINTGQTIPPIHCSTYAYTIYFSFISAFLWTSVISSDLWHSIEGTIKFRFTSDTNLFYLYMIFAWGLSTLLTIVAYSADHNDFVPKYLQPKLGGGTCFITMETYPRMVFLFMPLCITFMMNIAFFILTALKIRAVKHELTEVTSHERISSKSATFHTNKHSFTIYLRLCIVMGLNWFIEGIIMITDVNEIFSQVLDMCNALTGVIIFGLFVLKPSVLYLIKKRWQFWFNQSSPSGSITSYASWITPENVVVNVKPH